MRPRLPTHSEKAPPDEKQHDKPHRRKRSVLLEQQLPIDPHSRLPVLLTILPQPLAHVSHPLQAVPPIQQVLNIFRHDLCHVPQLVVELVEVLRGAAVLVGFLGALDEGVELDEGVGAQGGRLVGARGVGGGKLGREVGEIGKGEFARVGLFADGEEADAGGDEVAGSVSRSVSCRWAFSLRRGC